MPSLHKIVVQALAVIAAFHLLVTNGYAQSAPMIPGGLSGTYQLTYSGTTHSTFPFKNGDKVTFVLNSSTPSICVNGTAITYGAMLTVSDVRFVASPIQYILRVAGNTLTEISVYRDFKSLLQNPETYLGKFTGTRLNTSTDCTGAAPTLTTQEDTLLQLAQDLYPSLFSNGSELGSLQGYVYKHFPASGVYVGFKDGRLYLLGGQFGSNLTDMGTVANAVASLQAEKAAQFSNIAPGVHWVFNGVTRDDPRGAVTISNYGFQTGSGKGLSISLVGGSVFSLGMRWTIEIVSPTASPVVVPAGRYACSLTSGASVQVLLRDDNFFGTLRGGDCYIEFGKPVSVGQPVVGTFRMVSGSTLVTGSFNVTP